jgi:ABC-type sugar transport system ATPase subunit
LVALSERAAILEIGGVAKQYGATTVLDGLDMSVPSGGFFVLYGPPASGKTVLIRIVMGLEQPTGGSIRLRGQGVAGVPAADRNIGYVPQSFALYPHISVYDNIAYPLKLANVDRRERDPIVQHAAEMLKITDLLQKRPDQLSGGQKQRVAIARGIAKQTDLFVLDDPLAGLDFKLREQLVDDLRELQASAGITFLYTTSDAIEALTLADTVAVLDSGRVAEAGPPERLYESPARAATMRLLGFPGANFLPGTLTSRNGSRWCSAGALSFPVELSRPLPDGDVAVGLRPEAIHLNGRQAAGNGDLRLQATVLLREDLGGEEILYLDIDGTAVTTVVRHDAGEDAGTDRVTVTIGPRDLVLFTEDGAWIGRGASTHG